MPFGLDDALILASLAKTGIGIGQSLFGGGGGATALQQGSPVYAPGFHKTPTPPIPMPTPYDSANSILQQPEKAQPLVEPPGQELQAMTSIQDLINKKGGRPE